MCIDCLKSVCFAKRRPRSSTVTASGSARAGVYRSGSRHAAIEPPKPLPAMRTSTRSAISPPSPSRQAPRPRPLAAQPPPVREVAVALQVAAGQAHDAVARGLLRGLLLGERGGAERGERDRGGRLPQDAARVVEAQALQ